MIKSYRNGDVTLYDADSADEFHADHNHAKGCQLARTAGSCTLECDTHHASLYWPVLLPEI
jgi:hypothetical protein